MNSTYLVERERESPFDYLVSPVTYFWKRINSNDVDVDGDDDDDGQISVTDALIRLDKIRADFAAKNNGIFLFDLSKC